MFKQFIKEMKDITFWSLFITAMLFFTYYFVEIGSFFINNGPELWQSVIDFFGVWF